MKSTGKFFTWNNKQTGDQRVFSRIDRALCNEEWVDAYPRASKPDFLVHFFDFIRGKPMFKFCNYSASKPDFVEVVEWVWHRRIPGHIY